MEKDGNNVIFSKITHYAVLFIFPIILSSLTMYLLKGDVIETMHMGREFAFSYPKHPPLTFWLAGSILKTLPINIMVPVLSVLLYIVYFVIIQSSLKFSRYFLEDAKTISMVGISVFVSLFVKHIDFTPDIIITLLSSLVIVSSYEVIKHDKWQNWIALVTFALLAFLTKYQSVVLFAGVALSFLLTKEGCQRLFSKKAFVCSVIFLLLASLYMLYIYTQQTTAVSYAAHRIGNFSFIAPLFTPLAATFVPLVFLLFFFTKSGIVKSFTNFKNRLHTWDFTLVFLLSNTIGFLLVFMIFGYVFEHKVQTRFIFQNIIAFAVLFVYLIEPLIISVSKKKLVFFQVFVVTFAMLAYTFDNIKDNRSILKKKLDVIALKVESSANQPIEYVIQNGRELDVLYASLKAKPFYLRNDQMSYANLLRSINGKNFVLVWENSVNPPKWVVKLQKDFPNLEIGEAISLNSQQRKFFGIKLKMHNISIGYAYLNNE